LQNNSQKDKHAQSSTGVVLNVKDYIKESIDPREGSNKSKRIMVKPKE